MEGPPLGPGGEDITWSNQMAPRGRKASSTRKIKPQTSNLSWEFIIKDMTGSSLTQSRLRSVLHHVLTFFLRTRICRSHRGLLVCE